MTGVEHLRATRLHDQRRIHRGRQIATAAGWRTIRDTTVRDIESGTVIVSLVGGVGELFLWPYDMVSVRNHHELERGNCFGVYHHGVVAETHRELAAAQAAATDPADAYSLDPLVVLVCPVHPQFLADEWCGECTDEDLPAVLAAEDVAEEHGLRADDRRTCHLCKTWATHEHVASAAHRAKRLRAAAGLNALPLSA